MITRALCFSLLVLSATTGVGQNISDVKLDNKQSILNGKAFFLFPTDAKNIARQADIMSADPNTNKETRIMLDRGNQRLVFFARELYATSNDKLLETVSKDYTDHEKIKVLTKQDSLLSVLVTPVKFDSTENAILVNNLYVRTPDNMVFVIGAYINPEAFKDKQEYELIAEKVFSSISKGNRRLNYAARVETLPIVDGSKKFSFTLPVGYIVTKDKKYDFEVLGVQKVRDMADTSWSNLTIYLGRHPSSFYQNYGFNLNSAVKTKHSILGNHIDWFDFKDTPKQIYLREQQVSNDRIGQGMIVHIAMLGNNQAAIDELTKIVEAITFIE